MGSCSTKAARLARGDNNAKSKASAAEASFVGHVASQDVDAASPGRTATQRDGGGKAALGGGNGFQENRQEPDNQFGDKTVPAGNSSSDSWLSSEYQGDDEGNNARRVASGDASDPIKKMSSSKLEELARRRLSVSTIQARPTSGEKGLVGSTPALLRNGTLETKNEREVTTTVPRRSLIKKFTDPALQLVDERRCAIKEVSVAMIMELIPDAHSSLAFFGSPSWSSQKGFDNKEVNVAGSLGPKPNLISMGIGYACKKGLKPESPNQDDFFILKVDDWSMFGVFDGHGPFGHEVSNFVHTALPFLIISDPQFEEDTPATLRRAFRKVHNLLEAAAEQADAFLDCTLSGTTATVAVFRDNKLYVAHVGDSRAVLAKRLKDTPKSATTDLTADHKPTLDGEKARIVQNGGEVRRLEGDVPYRVFVKNRMYPGLAMSRAIGDSVGAAVGVISDPDINVTDVNPNDDCYLVISTDGVWEFITSEQAVDFCSRKSKAQVQDAADFLAYESWRRWVEEEEHVVDDVTTIVAYLNN